MCTKEQQCEHVQKLTAEKQNSITRYWSVISGLVAVLITIVVFYANTTNAMQQVNDHEQRLRAVEKSIVSTETLLQRISDQVKEVDNKLDQHIDRWAVSK